jgi:heat-inducible transcriptional repressor
MDPELLSERERQILEAIVRNYIISASPTSSRYLSRQKDFSLSSASIRNVMYDLEERGFITQPHTSAGRIPTDKGYRYYVDQVMKCCDLPKEAKSSIRNA